MSRKVTQESTSSSSQRASTRLANNTSSSSNPVESRNGRKRPAEEVVEIDVENQPNANGEDNEDGDEVPVGIAKKYDVENFIFPRNEKDVQKFEALSKEAQAQCVKAVCRLLIMKGAKKETVTKETIRKVLSEIDKEYKKHLNVVLSKAQVQLNRSMGYVVVSGDQILGMKRSGKSDEYYVSNNLNSPKLMKMLNEAKRYNHYTQSNIANNNRNNNNSNNNSSSRSQRNSSSSSKPNYNDENSDDEDGETMNTSAGGEGSTTIAFAGFVILVCGTIYTAHQKKISCSDLLAQVRKVDPRFPTKLSDNASRGLSACPVPELELEFLGLIRRMVKEHFLIEKRSVGDKDDSSKIYTLGPRFYLDVGRKPLMIQYFQLMDMPIDEIIMKEIDEDALKEQEEFEEEEGEQPQESQRAPEPAVATQTQPTNNTSSNGKAKKAK